MTWTSSTGNKKEPRVSPPNDRNHPTSQHSSIIRNAKQGCRHRPISEIFSNMTCHELRSFFFLYLRYVWSLTPIDPFIRHSNHSRIQSLQIFLLEISYRRVVSKHLRSVIESYLVPLFPYLQKVHLPPLFFGAKTKNKSNIVHEDRLSHSSPPPPPPQKKNKNSDTKHTQRRVLSLRKPTQTPKTNMSGRRWNRCPKDKPLGSSCGHPKQHKQ